MLGKDVRDYSTNHRWINFDCLSNQMQQRCGLISRGNYVSKIKAPFYFLHVPGTKTGGADVQTSNYVRHKPRELVQLNFCTLHSLAQTGDSSLPPCWNSHIIHNTPFQSTFARFLSFQSRCASNMIFTVSRLTQFLGAFASLSAFANAIDTITVKDRHFVNSKTGATVRCPMMTY
jgi:hypothetical protein